MPAELITTDDLRRFKSELIDEIKDLFGTNDQSAHLDRWLRSSDVERLLNISPNKLYQMRVNNEIPYYRFGSTIYYKYQDIENNMIPA